MMKGKLTKSRMNQLIDELQHRFDPESLDQGWALYHRGLVIKGTIQQKSLLRALVDEHPSHHVLIDIDAFSKSECDCGQAQPCGHMAAVILAAYALHGRPELLFIQAKHAQLNKTRTSTRSALVREKTAERPAEPQDRDLPEEWQRIFDQRFRGYTLTHSNSVESFYSLAIDSLSPFASDWDSSLKGIYELHIYLFVLRTLDGFHQSHQQAYTSFYHEAGSRALAARCIQKTEELAAALSHKLDYQAYSAQWDATLRYVRELCLQSKPGPVEWLDVYRILWEKVFRQIADTRREAAELTEWLNHRAGTPRQQDMLHLAIAHFDFMKGHDSDAMERMAKLHQQKPSDFWHLLNQLKRREEWERLLQWLRWLLPLMAKMKQNDFHTACSYWVELTKQLPVDEEWIQVMHQLLPKSYAYYTDYLMNTQRYRQWIDLQLANGIAPSSLYPEQLRRIEAADPNLLLPLYHQSIERLIMEKNRNAYLAAIREMRVLLALYQKLGLEQRWRLYVELLSSKFSRLRAFQQELKKGKWLS
ncbi:SWIM zinc finger family protein [Paenibacillus senegalensis]|uniref:SWIM zinc finger family protein n=1 Tax=Paenibacillus senegalensis TaxID=1465766 RepID=UPI0002890A0F|nr:SWIM zinc finger family protein [Paenibacillus senegalensis]